MSRIRLSASAPSRFNFYPKLFRFVASHVSRGAVAVGSLLLALLAAVAAPAAAQTTMNVELTPSDSTATNFGQAMAIDGDTMVASANVGSDVNDGAAFVFTKSGSTWTQQAELYPSDHAQNDYYGYSVAISGNTIVVGATGHKDQNGAYGAVYVYTGSGSTWTQQAELTVSNGAQDFGWSVAISGDTLVVGDLAVDGDQGAAYVYTRSNGTWTLQATLTASDGVASDFFGYSVAISGSTIVVGASHHASNYGAAYVFTGSGSNTNWTQAAELSDPGSYYDYAGFGWSVAIDGGTIVVGSPGQSLSATLVSAGAAYVYTGSDSTWTEQVELTAPVPGSEDDFGNAVAVNGGTIVVGESGRDSDAGAAYVYTGSGSSWMYQEELKGYQSGSGELFGASVGVSGDTIGVAASNQGNSNSNGPYGAVFVGVLPPISLTSPSASTIAYGQETTDLTATVSPAEGSPTGTMLFVTGGSTSGGIFYGGGTSSSGAYVLGSQVLGGAEVSSGEAEISQVLLPGSYNMQAYYVGDGNLYLPVYSTVTNYTVNLATVEFSLPSSVRSVQGTASSFQASLTGYSTATGVQPPTGTISYALLNASNATVASGSVALSGGAATIPVSSTLAAGSYTCQFTYSGDSNYNAITTPSTAPLTVSGAAVQLAVSSYPATVYAGVANTGTVTAYDYYYNLATGFSGTVSVSTSESSTPIAVTLTNGVGTFSASFATAATGQYITASYTGFASISETGITVNATPSYVVNTARDDATGVAANCTSSPEGTCTLRDALAATNADGGGNISFASTVFGSVRTITLTSGNTLTIPSNTTITGPTTGSGSTLQNLVTVDGGGGAYGSFSIFTLANGVTGAAIANLNLANGNGGNGGGIQNSGTLTVTNSTFSGNSTTSYIGGGIVNRGTLTVTGSTFSGNSAPNGGGIGNFYGTLTVTNSAFSGNSAPGGFGGGIASNGTLTVTNSTFAGNSAPYGGGGVFGAGTLTVTNSTFAGNSAPYGEGGGIFNDEGTLALANSVLSGNTASGTSDDLDDTGSNSSFPGVIGSGSCSGVTLCNAGGNVVGVLQPRSGQCGRRER